MIFALPTDECALLGPGGMPIAARQLILRAHSGEPRANFTPGQTWLLHWRQSDRRSRQQHAIVERARFATPGCGVVEFRAGLNRLIWTPGTRMAPAEPIAPREAVMV
ncbi:hypothetical protein CBW24_14490 [Pacificitalea manganoxidans]|uniref:Uncharacterized protein n=1 Tax=Pacificitalea manganoxidans TaxID=1411902 RepID=A0A291M2D3_9RHOB|nr:hypothetical protein [Pacificitalea manganoxidans]ATI43092.1 hypothetical protein CBW24_14490 [Pacificitalea manganoxidans]MDR6306972.1 hypothetical protein [Pacificitalea manganoxidans]